MAISKKSRRIVVWSVIGVAVVALIVYANRPVPVEVDAAVVSRGSMRVTIDADGVTRVRDRYTISAPAAGVAARMALRQGDSVSVGSVVARLAPIPLDASSLAQAEARVQSALAMHQASEATVAEVTQVVGQARRVVQRARSLFEAGGVSQREVDDAELALASAVSQQEAAGARARASQSDLSAARLALTLGTQGSASNVISVRAPVAGRVLRLYEESERAVQPGMPLVDLGDRRKGLEVVIDVLSTEAVRVNAGNTMLLEGWGGTDSLIAIVRSVGPGATTRISALGVEEQRVEIVGDIHEPPPSLGDGYRATARIVVWQSDSALRVPTAALFQRDGKWALFQIAEGRAQLRTVRIGERGAEWTQVIDGLAEGDRVVLYPSDRVAEGVVVRER